MNLKNRNKGEIGYTSRKTTNKKKNNEIKILPFDNRYNNNWFRYEWC